MFSFIFVALYGYLIIAPSAESLSNNFQGMHEQPPLNSKFSYLIFICSFHLNAVLL